VACNGADIGAIDVNTDRWSVDEGVFDLVYISNLRRNRRDLPWDEMQDGLGFELARPIGSLVSRDLRTPKHADESPHGVIMDRRALPRTPYEADNREALQWVAVEKILAILCRIGFGKFRREPIIDGHQIAQ
jgi:hypothetical protein